MFKKFVVASLLSICGVLSVCSQSWNSVQNNPLYYTGEGWGNSVAEAEQQAYSSLLNGIVVHVTSSSSDYGEGTMKNNTYEEFSQFSSTVNTWSSATLTNVNRVIIHNEPDAHVGVWVLKTEVDKIFALRTSKILDMVELADAAEEKGKIDVALRNYYGAMTLLKSIRQPEKVMYTDSRGKEHMLVTWLPERISEVMGNLSAKVVKRTGDDVELFISYNGKPVNSVDYTYFDGSNWSNIYSAKDGCGVLELMPGCASDNYQLKYEFEYRSQAQIDQELKSVMDAVKSTPIRSAYVNVKSSVGAMPSASAATASTFTSTDASIIKAPTAISQDEKYAKVINEVIKAITSKNYDIDRRYFTDFGAEIYDSLIKYGRARIVGTPSLTFYQNGDYVVGRGVQMSFTFSRGARKSFVEDMVFTFDDSDRICNIAFGLGNTAADDILNKGVWSEQARMSIMNFLENYKTAYGLKRLDYIESIFDDDAVIIIGSVVKKYSQARSDYGPTAMNNQIIRKNRLTKDQYLNNLKRVFGANEFINIRFANNDVYKMSNGGELYAIQIEQDYYSTYYGDHGWLFLLVDLNDPQNPIIKVRTWQEAKDPNFGLYGPGDF